MRNDIWPMIRSKLTLPQRLPQLEPLNLSRCRVWQLVDKHILPRLRESRQRRRRLLSQSFFNLDRVGFYILPDYKRTCAGKLIRIEVLYHRDAADPRMPQQHALDFNR